MQGERIERRLVAILAADVAGYSRLMGVDEEGTHARYKAHWRELIEPTIAEHRGRVVKTTGDGFLVQFPSVLEAARCAVAIQQGIAERNTDEPAGRRIEFRLGIHVGDVIADSQDIFGDGVNVAARLQSIAEPGGILISARVHEDIAGKLPLAFEALGAQALKNIARPVGVYRVTPAKPRLSPDMSGMGLPLPHEPSIVVLPFANMSGDPEQEYFADGITEEITTALGRLRGFLVIARNSAFTYKGKAVQVQQVGRDLGVRYVLEGSVRKSGERVRIGVQLADAGTGREIWAER